MTSALPFDFGEFSIRSLGVTVNLSPTLGQLYPRVAQGLLCCDGTTARQHFATLLAEETSRDARFTLLGYASCIVHELRHYHDYLTTPFGAGAIADHVLASRYILPILYFLGEEPAIGLPLQQWQTLSPRLTSAYRSRTRSGKFADRPPEAIGRFTESADAILKRVRLNHSRSVKWPDVTIETRDLLEVSALTIQTEELERQFGREHAVAFARYVNEMGVDTYTHVFALFNQLANELAPGSFFSPTVISAMIFFALCGSFKPDEEWSHPCDRLMAVLAYLQASRDFPTDDNILDILDHVAEKVYKIKTIRESLAASVTLQKTLADGLPKLSPGGAAKLLDNDLVEAYRGWAKAHEHMVSKVLDDPMSYLNPTRYLQNLSQWVAAPIYLGGARFATAAEAPLIAKMREAGWTVVWAYDDLAIGPDEPLGIGLMSAPGLTPGEPVLSEAHARHLSVTTWLVYLLWSPDMLNAIQRSVGAAMLKKANSSLEVLLL